MGALYLYLPVRSQVKREEGNNAATWRRLSIMAIAGRMARDKRQNTTLCFKP
jgi:hypothetical protein